MDEVNPELSPDVNLQQLIDSALKQRRIDSTELLNHWEELKRDESKLLEASSFSMLRDYLNKIDISVKCESRKDWIMWSTCLAVALKRLKIKKSIENCATSVSVKSVNAVNAARIVNFIAPLFHRTKFLKIDIEAVQTPTPEPQNERLLEKLINSALKLQREDSKRMRTRWNELKMNPSDRLKCFFIFYTLEDQSDRIELTIESTYTMSFSIEMNSEDVGSVFESLKHFAHRVFVCSARFENVLPDIFGQCSEFFEVTQVDRVWFTEGCSANLNYKVWLDFIGKVQPLRVFYDRSDNLTEIQDFLVPLGDLVESLTIVV